MMYSTCTSQEQSLEAASDMINAVALVNKPAFVSSPQMESVDKRQIGNDATPSKATVSKDDELSMTSLNRNSAGIVDILNRQIQHCASAGEQQDVKRLMFTFRRKPLPTSSSGVFKSVAAELNTETSKSNRVPAGVHIIPDSLPTIRRSSILSFGDSIVDSGSCQQQQQKQQIFNVKQQDYSDVGTSTTSLSPNGGKWLTIVSTSFPASSEHTVRLTSKQYRSSPVCRRALYEKYLDQHEVWAEGLTANGKQTLLDVQRRVRRTSYLQQQQPLWLLPGRRPSRSQTALPATRTDPGEPVGRHRRQAFSASSTVSSTLPVK